MTSKENYLFMDKFTSIIKGEQATIALAKKIATKLKRGDCLLLSGDLACGKTFFTKALAIELGFNGLVTSPTFTIVHSYEINLGTLLHIDVYRLSDNIEEFHDLGLDEFFDESVTIVEWGDRVLSAFDTYLLIKFELCKDDSSHRKITITGNGERWIFDFNSLIKSMEES